MWTADKEVNMKTILAIMNTTYAVVKITPENKVEHCTGIKEVMGSNPMQP